MENLPFTQTSDVMPKAEETEQSKSVDNLKEKATLPCHRKCESCGKIGNLNNGKCWYEND